MKLKERKALAFAAGVLIKCELPPIALSTYVNGRHEGYLAGFEAARELALATPRPFTLEAYKNAIRELGEEEVEG